ncbi:hypothetical protein A2U01_0030270 [Trifolium medium]|uniref:Uncharacterized protein n=1 Tax=Trifolium medium TaxID=97028 RepID=A0A392PC45_9FABA|nr:hypothetical protein [Trifolium medium]
MDLDKKQHENRIKSSSPASKERQKVGMSRFLRFSSSLKRPWIDFNQKVPVLLAQCSLKRPWSDCNQKVPVLLAHVSLQLPSSN